MTEKTNNQEQKKGTRKISDLYIGQTGSQDTERLRQDLIRKLWETMK